MFCNNPLPSTTLNSIICSADIRFRTTLLRRLCAARTHSENSVVVIYRSISFVRFLEVVQRYRQAIPPVISQPF
jgi:hypothetical protein